MQHLLPDAAFLGDLCEVRRRVDVPLRAVRIDVFYPEMQMFAARLSELLPGLDSIPGLDGDFAEVHIGTLHLAAVFPAVFHGHGLPATASFHGDYLASVFRGEDGIPVTPDVQPLVDFLATVGRAAVHTERGGDKKEILPFDRKGIGRAFRFSQRVFLHAEMPSLCRHFLHDLTVISVKTVLLDDFLQVGGIAASRGISGPGDAFRPPLVVVWRQIEAGGIAAVFFQETGVVLVGVAHGVIAAELLVWPVVRIQGVPSAFVNP